MLELITWWEGHSNTNSVMQPLIGLSTFPLAPAPRVQGSCIKAASSHDYRPRPQHRAAAEHLNTGSSHLAWLYRSTRGGFLGCWIYRENHQVQRRGILTQRPTEKHRSKAGRMLGRGSSRMGPVALRSLRKQPRRALETGWQAWNWGRSRIRRDPGRRDAFLSVLIPLIAPCCSQPSPIRTGSLCLMAKLSPHPYPPPTLCGPCLTPSEQQTMRGDCISASSEIS